MVFLHCSAVLGSVLVIYVFPENHPFHPGLLRPFVQEPTFCLGASKCPRYLWVQVLFQP